jgi:hypothetical protein
MYEFHDAFLKNEFHADGDEFGRAIN